MAETKTAFVAHEPYKATYGTTVTEPLIVLDDDNKSRIAEPKQVIDTNSNNV